MNARTFYSALLLGLLLSLVAWAFWMTRVVGAAELAAPARPVSEICQPGQFQQHDMAGTYESRYMLLIMYPCGGSALSWMNDYGEHTAVYYSEDRLPGGGVVAYGYMPDPDIHAYLDSVDVLMIKPAEPGWVHVYPVTEGGVIQRMYRLMKTT